MEEKQVFRKNVMDRLNSPEELNDYLHVTRPAVWIALAAVILILIGALVWSSATYVNSYVNGTAEVKGGVMTVLIDPETPFADRIEVGQNVIVGDTTSTISGLGFGENGGRIATASCSLSDGTYPAKIQFSQTQMIEMIFN